MAWKVMKKLKRPGFWKIKGVERTGESLVFLEIPFPARVFVRRHTPTFCAAYTTSGIYIGFGKLRRDGTFRLEGDGRTAFIAGFLTKGHPFLQ